MRSTEDRSLIERVRSSLALLNRICFGFGMSEIEKAHAALIEGAEDFSSAAVEYWSSVRDGINGPSVTMCLYVAERCPVCHRSKAVFVIRASGAQCRDCDDAGKNAVAQADGLPSEADFDAYFEERRIAEETA